MRYLVLALLCVLAYAPTLTIPLIEDDYPNITQAQVYGSAEGLPQLVSDGVFRLRATSYWLIRFWWTRFGLNAFAYHLASLALHIANTWLLYRAAQLWRPMQSAAFWAAAFFAVHEGHQEAVMWFSAVNELLMFTFGMGAMICWLVAIDRKRRLWHIPALGLFSLALLSKESAIVFLPLFILVASPFQWRRIALGLLPYAVLSGLAVVSILLARHHSFRFADGSFSLAAPFWKTLPHSLVRLLWFWGVPSIAALIWLRRGGGPQAVAWAIVSLIPYSFLTYSTAIPSRQVYLASAGLALLVGLAAAALQSTQRPWVIHGLLAIALVHNVSVLWVRKREQFLLRAAPTEQLIGAARDVEGNIWVRCFPRQRLIAEEAVRLTSPRARVVWTADEPRAAEFCYREPR